MIPHKQKDVLTTFKVLINDKINVSILYAEHQLFWKGIKVVGMIHEKVGLQKLSILA